MVLFISFFNLKFGNNLNTVGFPPVFYFQTLTKNIYLWLVSSWGHKNTSL